MHLLKPQVISKLLITTENSMLQETIYCRLPRFHKIATNMTNKLHAVALFSDTAEYYYQASLFILHVLL